MKIFNYGSLLLITILLVAACKKEELSTWEDKGSVWFAFENLKDTTHFTFASLSDNINETVIELPIGLLGTKESYDREIGLTVIQQPHHPDTKYEILKPLVIYADSTKGYIKIRAWRTDNLNIERDTIVFELQPSKDLNIDIKEHLTCYLVLSNHYERPDWWTPSIEWHLGLYSEEKLRIIQFVLGSIESPYPTSDEMAWRLNKYKLDKYIEENSPTYEDGTPIKFEYGHQ